MSDPLTEAGSSIANFLRRSPLLRVLLVGFLVLLLQIPIAMIYGLIGERQSTRGEAVKEVTGKWGEAQRVIGPVIAVPYLRRWVEEEKGQQRVRTEQRRVAFLPESLGVEGRVETEIRYRGIFKVPVYRMTLDVKGRFAPPDLRERGISPEEVLWDRAQLWVRIADARAIQNQAGLTWRGRPIAFAPGTGDFGDGKNGIHAPLRGQEMQGGGEFSFPLVLNGSVATWFAPLGGETKVHLTSNWPDPKFEGNWLPSRRDVTASGFEAEWSIPSLGRNYPQSWTSETPVSHDALDASRFGFELLNNQDYALLIGSMGLFLILAVVMYLTRKVDWYGAGR